MIVTHQTFILCKLIMGKKKLNNPPKRSKFKIPKHTKKIKTYPLHDACSIGDAKVLKALLELIGPCTCEDTDPNSSEYNHTCPINARDKLNWWTPLHYASLQKTPECIIILFQYGADHNAETSSSALDIVCSYGPVENLRELLKHGNIDKTFISPLFNACSHGRYDCLEELIQFGYIVKNQNTVLHDAARGKTDERCLKCLQLLLPHELNMCEMNKQKESALHLICKKGYLESIGYFLEHYNEDQLPFDVLANMNNYYSDNVNILLSVWKPPPITKGI
jgi:ankyrin repeat protein